MRETSDVTLAELQQPLSEQESLDGHLSTSSRALSSLGLPRKNPLVAAERNHNKRAWYWRRVRGIEPRRLRFIDEAGINLALKRLYGHAPQAASESSNQCPATMASRPRSSAVCGLVESTRRCVSPERLIPRVFDAQVEQVLRPTIRASGVIVLDNLMAHEASQIEGAHG